MVRFKLSKMLIYSILAISTVASLFPFYWLIRSSLMTSREIFSLPIKWLPAKFMFENYSTALTSLPFILYFRNSVFLVVMNILGNILSSSFCAFGYSRLNFKGRNVFFFILLATMMMPNSILLIPMFIGWKLVGAYNTYFPLIVPAFLGNAFFIFLLRQFFMTIPKEYDESAFIDGASYLRIYSSIIMPLSKPALTTVGVFTFMSTWNDFFGPLIYLSDNTRYTLALGLLSFIGRYTTQWHLLMAASTVIILPMVLLFFFAQKFFIEGITFTGIKA